MATTVKTSKKVLFIDQEQIRLAQLRTANQLLNAVEESDNETFNGIVLFHVREWKERRAEDRFFMATKHMEAIDVFQNKGAYQYRLFCIKHDLPYVNAE